MLKSGDEIVGVADHKHVHLRDFLSPYIYSEVEHKQPAEDSAFALEPLYSTAAGQRNR